MSEIRITLEGRDLSEVEAEAVERGVSKAEALRSMLRELAVYRRMSGGFTAESRRFDGVAPQTAPSPSLPGPSSSPPPSPEPLSPPSLSPPDPLTHTHVCKQDEIEKGQVGGEPLPEHGLRGDEPIPEERLRDAFPDYPLPEPLLFPGAEPLPKPRKKRETWTAENLAESRSIVEEIAAAAAKKRTKPVPAAKLSLSEALAQVPEFAEFWTAYPKRQGGVDAFKAWQQTASSRPPLPSLLSALRRQVAGLWAGSEARFVPLAGTWLRGERWNDEVGGGAVVPMPAAARASPGVDLPALKRAVQAEVGGALGGRVSREELAEILDEMETINDEPSLRRWADEAVRR